ncbi:MAG TPA: zinc-ribbon domain-containing protein [Bacteroidota bacterium]|nr:zinc-ribbon domain-containing protein [Bacteroidota bacterium]
MELDTCYHCGEEVTDDSDFCPHCGVLFETKEEIFCDLHPQAQAVAVCIICKTVLCSDCCRVVGGRAFCVAHRSVQVQEDWAEVFRSTEINEAELVKAVLESAGKKVLVQNFNSMGFVWDGGGDSPISRSNVNKPAKVLVPIPEYLEAMQTIAEWRSSTDNLHPEETESDI